MCDSELVKVVQQLCQQLQVCQLQLVTAESCTGGLLASMLTSIEGSSAWFERGFVTYSNQAKQEILQVPASILQAHGAVSWQWRFLRLHPGFRLVGLITVVWMDYYLL